MGQQYSVDLVTFGTLEAACVYDSGNAQRVFLSETKSYDPLLRIAVKINMKFRFSVHRFDQHVHLPLAFLQSFHD